MKNEPKEITIRIKDEEKTIKQKFLVYEEVEASSDDAIIAECVAETSKDYKGEPESITVTIKFQLI